MSDERDAVVRSLTGSPDRPAIDLERHLRVAPAEAWDAVVRPSRLARWLGVVEGGEAPAPGEAFRIRIGDGDDVDCRLLACDPGRSLLVAWHGRGEPESTVRLSVAETPTGSVLRLRHELHRSPSVGETGAGWEAHLEGIGDALSGLEPRTSASSARARWQRLADGVLHLERRVEAPIDAVWRAFATVEGLRSWWWRHWADTTIEADLRVGGWLRIEAPGAGIVLAGRILELDHRTRHLAATWSWSDAEGTSADEAFDVALAADGDATLVVVRHSGPWTDDGPATAYRAGWAFVLGELAAVLGPDGR